MRQVKATNWPMPHTWLMPHRMESRSFARDRGAGVNAAMQYATGRRALLSVAAAMRFTPSLTYSEVQTAVARRSCRFNV